MPLRPFERTILRLLAQNRHPESFVAGGTVLNRGPDSPRMSEDIDLFHDTETAVQTAVEQDVPLLLQNGYLVDVTFRTPTFVRATVRRAEEATKLEWVFDSAFRFFPTEPDDELGYRLNFWDAATNKALAGAARSAARDYVDLIHIHESRLRLGAVVWAAAGKDEGLGPSLIIEELARHQHFPPGALAALRLNPPADPARLKRVWLTALDEARELIATVLRDAPYGCLFLDASGTPQTPTAATLGTLKPHFGSIRGCLPRLVEA